ncbi:Rpn family recombination-promoting nuclease/putative transposase [Allocoprobacillus halotolerans]|uniref:Rpn family recombination-promoting nuclease/putative transposase n=1 Tax=Allocoprobacillus halotolerans TaxID=2944914 RepID=A0ABY5I8P7_9FIRM|nr:Rpn family recombination-promoting nuclease/putative transposase [Allocoprobacillus halotolerans]UTY40636.1 Rpn family recombination-promoting nuclease/putative transposase [Allocoprobacillus halotolerans]
MKDLKVDDVIRDFFRNPEHFADMMNAILYGGQNVIKPDELQRMDTSEIFVGNYISRERRRDVIMLWKGKDSQAILALEAQDQVDFTMVSRTLLYDALTYNMQDKEYKSYKIMPVVSLVLFHGEGRWTAATSLVERMDIPESLKGMSNDWKMKIVDIKDLDYHLLKNEDNRNIVKTVNQIWRKEKEDFKGMEVSKTAARVIAILTERYDILKQVRGEEGTMAMWSFWKDIEDSGIRIGEERGMKRGMELGMKKGMLELVILQLKKVLGTLTPELTLKIELSNEEELNNLALHITDIHSEKDVYQILQ